MRKLTQYSQYKNDIFNKLDFDFEYGKSVLDIGCGDCSDAKILSDHFKLKVYGIDVYEHPNAKNVLGNRFICTDKGVYDIPFPSLCFDYVFLHDVLHHVDEKGQKYKNHILALRSVQRVVKPGGFVIVVEGNRYNLLFYPHMVKMLGHEHFSQKYFVKLIQSSFIDYTELRFKFFEAHAYPFGPMWFWRTYEYVMEKFSPERFLAYNIAIIRL